MNPLIKKPKFSTKLYCTLLIKAETNPSRDVGQENPQGTIKTWPTQVF